VAAACSVVDREGLNAMTMRRLGAELGADPTAVYRHFASKDDLLAAIADHLFSEFHAEVERTADWPRNLRAILERGFALYHEHPAMAVELARQRDDTAALTTLADALIHELRAAGLDDRDAALTYHTLVDVIVGVGLFHALVPDMADPDERAAMQRAYGALPAARYPDSAGVAPFLYPPAEDVFASTVELLIDGIEQRVRRTAGTGTQP
jgi:TetR/AcrR family transcriptional regulator, tetracycline repressor protein